MKNCQFRSVNFNCPIDKEVKNYGAIQIYKWVPCWDLNYCRQESFALQEITAKNTLKKLHKFPIFAYRKGYYLYSSFGCLFRGFHTSDTQCFDKTKLITKHIIKFVEISRSTSNTLLKYNLIRWAWTNDGPWL